MVQLMRDGAICGRRLENVCYFAGVLPEWKATYGTEAAYLLTRLLGIGVVFSAFGSFDLIPRFSYLFYMELFSTYLLL
jgi:hypothetical protein